MNAYERQEIENYIGFIRRMKARHEKWWNKLSFEDWWTLDCLENNLKLLIRNGN